MVAIAETTVSREASSRAERIDVAMGIAKPGGIGLRGLAGKVGGEKGKHAGKVA
jgi:hypothetical protein